MSLKNKGLNIIKLFLFCMIAIIHLSLTGCSISDSYSFPAISYNKITPAISSPADDYAPINIASGNLKVALPLSGECLQYLSFMYAGKAAGLFDDHNENFNGLDISQEKLQEYDVGLKISVQNINPEGFTHEEISAMELSNSLPDIFIVKDMNYLYNNNISPAALNNSYLNQYLKGSSIIPLMFQRNSDDNNFYSLPYYSSIKMMYLNTKIFIDSDNSKLIPSNPIITYNTIKSLSDAVTNSSSGIYAWIDLLDLSAFFPTTISPYPKSYFWDRSAFDFENKAYYSMISRLRTIAQSKTTVESLTDAQITELYGNNDPRAINKIAFWIDDSSKIDYWNTTMNLSCIRFPVPSEDTVNLPLSTIKIVVNPKSNLLEDSIRFATFIALDNNAILFRSRYSNPNGFIPPVLDEKVWENLVSKQYHGNELYQLRDHINYSHIIREDDIKKPREIYGVLYNEIIKDLLYRNVSTVNTGNLLNQKSAELLEGNNATFESP